MNRRPSFDNIPFRTCVQCNVAVPVNTPLCTGCEEKGVDLKQKRQMLADLRGT